MNKLMIYESIILISNKFSIMRAKRIKQLDIVVKGLYKALQGNT